MRSASVIAAFGFSLLLGMPAHALDGKAHPPAQPKHVKAAISCYNCHQEEAPTTGAGVTDASCMACHGDFAELAYTTRQLPVNPHTQPAAPHPGPAACKECHRQHQAPKVKCLECHPKFKITAK